MEVTHSGGEVNFSVDNANSATTVLANSFGIIAEDAAGSAGVSNVSGIPTFNSSARFETIYSN